MTEHPQPYCPDCGDVPMLGGDAPGADYWICPVCRCDLIVGREENYLTPRPPKKRK